MGQFLEMTNPEIVPHLRRSQPVIHLSGIISVPRPGLGKSVTALALILRTRGALPVGLLTAQPALVIGPQGLTTIL